MYPVYIVLPCFTLFWCLVGILGPIVTPRGPNQQIIRCMLMLTAASCYLMWFCVYMSQLNPLTGPKLSKNKYILMQWEWNRNK
uniref:V-type proton ATPase subunit n=1 Tax=Megaselia scalaris TaxID=36166 RepID=T1GW78_MEGSC